MYKVPHSYSVSYGLAGLMWRLLVVASLADLVCGVALTLGLGSR